MQDKKEWVKNKNDGLNIFISVTRSFGYVIVIFFHSIGNLAPDILL